MVDFWLPKGTHIEDSVAASGGGRRGVPAAGSTTRRTSPRSSAPGAMRFLVTYSPEKHGQLVHRSSSSTSTTSERIDELIDADRARGARSCLPDAHRPTRKKLPASARADGGRKIQARFSGPDSGRPAPIARPSGVDARSSTGGRRRQGHPDRLAAAREAKFLQPVLAEEEANRAGIDPDRRSLEAHPHRSFEGLERRRVPRRETSCCRSSWCVPRTPSATSVEQHRGPADLVARSRSTSIPLRQVVSRASTPDFEDDDRPCGFNRKSRR